MLHSEVVKILLLGDAGVGKTCLLSQLIEGAFIPEYSPTVGVDTVRSLSALACALPVTGTLSCVCAEGPHGDDGGEGGAAASVGHGGE